MRKNVILQMEHYFIMSSRLKHLLSCMFFGNLADMEAIMDICNKYNIKVIEDATEALGSKYITGKYAGKYAGTIGSMGLIRLTEIRL